MDIIENIKSQLISIENQKEQLRLSLYELEIQIKKLFAAIKDRESFEKAHDDFELLLKYMELLADIAFKHRFNLTIYLRNLLKDYERLDQLIVRQDLYNKLRLVKR